MELTELEIKLMKGYELGRLQYETPWVSVVIKESKIPAKIARGVISSLEQKGVIKVYKDSSEGPYMEKL